MKCEKIFIIFHGDPDVGIPRHEWSVEGGFEFDTDYDYDCFVTSIQDAFETQTGGRVSVETDTERAIDEHHIINSVSYPKDEDLKQ